ncbi:MAG TPA: NAD(P)H-quinone oxidoreductase [Longimicrobiales bacterium]|nr:NAD(P)H-quinone oxidoreductase [Longimicrobiales bacterium]
MNETMRAVVIREPGDPEVLEVRRVPIPEPGAGEVRVRVATSGLNRADLLQRRGRYPVPPGYPKDIPGLELAGTVDGVGEGVTRWSIGDAVMGILGGGGYAEHAISPASTLVSVPEGMTPAHAGAIPEVFMTAYDAAFLQERLAGGETLLVHAVGSGVGTAAVQLARRIGARVIGTSRTAGKLEQARDVGLDEPVLADDAWPERVLELTEGRGVDVILDLVGGPYLEGNQRVIAERGRHIVVGVPGGSDATLSLRTLMGRRASIRGTVLRARPLPEKEALAEAFTDHVLPGFAAGELRPVIDRTFPADEAAEAHRYMEENRNFGKILLAW